LALFTDPDFPVGSLNILTPMTFGEDISAPFDGAQLIADGPDQELAERWSTTSGERSSA